MRPTYRRRGKKFSCALATGIKEHRDIHVHFFKSASQSACLQGC
jgi:hypothetical protein